jgi:hypothetical protein
MRSSTAWSTADAHELDRRLRRAARLEQRLMAELAAGLLDVARGRLYRGLGFGSLDGWARERLGISPRKAQALLRLERAAQLCPALREAFRSGRLGWRQAHVLVPLVVLDHSLGLREAWVERAARVSLRRLEDEVQFALAHDVLDPHACAQAMGSEAEDPHACARASGSEERGRLFFSAPRHVAQLFRATLATVQRRIERREGRRATESEALEWMLDHALAAWRALAALHPREHFVFTRDGFRCTVPGPPRALALRGRRRRGLEPHAGTMFAMYFPCEAPREQHGRLKDEFSERIFDKVERYAPGFRDTILHQATFALPLREHVRLHRRRLLPRPDPPRADAGLPPRPRLGRRLPHADPGPLPVRRELPPRSGRHLPAGLQRRPRGAGGSGRRAALRLSSGDTEAP